MFSFEDLGILDLGTLDLGRHGLDGVPMMGGITISPASLPDGEVGTAYSQTLTASGGTAPYSFAVTAGALPDGLSLATNGTISGTPTMAITGNFTVTVTDNTGADGLRNYSIQVNEQPQPLDISGTPVLTAVSGEAYAGFTATASGGVSPYTYSLVGTWPAGLSVDSGTGAVSGAPTESGSFPGLSVRATDSASPTPATADLTTFTLDVGAALGISGTPVLTATEGQAYAGFSVSGSGGTAPYTYSVASGALPTGITLNSSTGAVSGTPTVNGTFANIVLRVTDDALNTADLAPFTLEVAAAGNPELLANPGGPFVDTTGWTAVPDTGFTLSGNNLRITTAASGARSIIASHAAEIGQQYNYEAVLDTSSATGSIGGVLQVHEDDGTGTGTGTQIVNTAPQQLPPVSLTLNNVTATTNPMWVLIRTGANQDGTWTEWSSASAKKA